MNLIIIGAGKGISQATAKIFGTQGFKVGLISRSQDKLNTLSAELSVLGVECAVATGDAGDAASLNGAIDQIIHLHGSPDVVLFNAFSFRSKGISDESWEDIVKSLHVNAGGAFHVLKRFLPEFQSRGYGKLFFTGGVLATAPMPRFLALGIGKAAMRNLVLAAAKTVSGTDVHVATLTVAGMVREGDNHYAPLSIAAQIMALFKQKSSEYQAEVVY